MSIYKQYFQKNAGREFPIYGYSPPPNGQWQIDDTIIHTEDFRTVEKYKEYKECGFTVLFLQHTALYKGEGWEKSETKMAFENALKAGIDKIILVDDRIFQLSLIPDGIIGEGKKFSTETELDEYIKNCIQDYKDQEGFLPYLKTVGQLYRSIARVDSKIFVHCNLNPLIIPSLNYQICPPGENMIDAYEKYLTTFLEETGTNHVMMDTYPFFKNTEKINVGRYYFAGLECVARVCKKMGVEMHIVAQSFGMKWNNQRRHVLPSERQMQYQKNVLIGFGVKQYSYFTYWTKQVNRTNGESFPDGEAMMNRRGEKTRMYRHVQKINKELTALAPLLWDFNYCANAFFVNKPFCIQPTFLEMTRGGKLSQVQEVQVDRDVVLVTEQYDKKKKQYMYCVTNVTDPIAYAKKYQKEKQVTRLQFNEKYNVADIYYKGKWSKVALDEGWLQISLYSGDGIIILPYKE